MALFKNKETDKKRKGENVIGKIIYGFLLFAPLISILFTSLYTVFNKNAYESYYGETINEKQLVHTNIGNLVNSYSYYFQNQLEPTETGAIPQSFLNVSNVTEITGSAQTIDNTLVNRIGVYYNASGIPYLRFYNNADVLGHIALNTSIGSFYFTFLSASEIIEESKHLFNDNLYTYSFNKYSYLDNSFEYGMYKTEQSNIYNWSKTTGTYTVLQNVCTGIGITNTFVPMLMAYWLLISIIYFLFDIALILIWAVHDKIHALKDAI